MIEASRGSISFGDASVMFQRLCFFNDLDVPVNQSVPVLRVLLRARIACDDVRLPAPISGSAIPAQFQAIPSTS